LIRKFFPLDKNYLLEEVQLGLQDTLLTQLTELVKLEFEKRSNPLGLLDEFSLTIKNYKLHNVKTLSNFYQNLAAVYRYKYSDNQLEFVWDGRDHQEKYKAEWKAAFIELTVFLPENRHADLAENRMNNFMLRQFELKMHKTKGLVAMKVA